MQSVQGHSAAATGLALLPQGIVAGLGTVLGRSLLTRTSIHTTVVAGFAILTVASLGLLAIDAHTSLAVTATILTGRAAIGLVITPLLYAVTSTLDTHQLADANSLFNGLIAALFTTRTHTHGPVPALHATALLLTAIAAAAALVAILPPISGSTPTPRRSHRPQHRQLPTRQHRPCRPIHHTEPEIHRTARRSTTGRPSPAASPADEV
jgi:predicted MFS family arabinose efflux permease